MAIYNLAEDALNEAFNVSGDSLVEAYDLTGTQVFSSSEPTPSDKYGRILNWSVNAVGWQTNTDAQYALFKDELESLGSTAIPVFISTDPHGGGAMSEHRWFHNHNVRDSLEAVNINLGDICVDTYQPSILSNMNAQTKWVRNFFTVPGNHDGKFGDIEPTVTTLRHYFGLANCFDYELSTYDTSASYVVYDDIHNIKWVAMDAYNHVGTGYTMPHPYITSAVMDWLIDVLSENDGYDIIFITHEPFGGIAYTNYSLSEPPDVLIPGSTSTYSQSERVWELLKARKNKRSGSINDDDGNSHTYDFTSCQKDLIVCLHGHTHALRYAKEDNLASIAFSRFYLINLVIIDVTHSLLKLWMASYGDAIFNEVDFSI